MKKLNLEKLKLASEEVLQRSQLLTIYGGSDCSTNGWYKCRCSSFGPWQSVYITDCSYPEDAMVECAGVVVQCESL